VQSFQIPQHYTVDFERHRIKLPKIGEIKTVFHRVFTGKMKYATVSVTSTGKWFVSILVDDGMPAPEPAPISRDTTLGIDVGLKDFATLSTGEKIENPRYLRKLPSAPEGIAASGVPEGQRVEESGEGDPETRPVS